MDVKNKAGQEYKTIWLKERQDATAAHQLFVKLHSVKRQDPDYPRGQTLFILNIPPTATENNLKHMLQREFPSISLVRFTSQANSFSSSFKNAYVVFDEESDLRKMLSIPEEYVFSLYNESYPGLFGVKKWCTEYNKTITNEETLKRGISKFFAKYDKKVKEKALDDKKAEDADEDGWVTVTGKKKRGKFATARKESVMKRLKEKNEIKTKKSLVNIYSFQIREAKKQHLIELRKKFELDKAKIQQYKMKRKFRPL